MKKIIQPAVREEAEFVCDITGKPAVVRLVMTFGYGSPRDTDVLEANLSSEAAEDVLKLIQSKYPHLKPKEDREGPLGPCPLCGRGGR
jgi:hypothetical protein